MERRLRDVAVLGAGPAGLAAATASARSGARVVILEREERPGGILKQCVHDGFGLPRFGEALAGPEYAQRFANEARAAGVEMFCEAFVEELGRAGARFVLRAMSRDYGAFEIEAGALVLATGCRERTDRQVFVHGERPAGILTAGLAQYFINVMGWLPGNRAVVLGSGDVGLIVARRLTLEGARVEGVYEVKPEASGLARNLRQCLEDFGIPLHLSSTVTEVHGRRRVEGVTVAAVDGRGAPIPGTERFVECDTLVLSVGLIPENETAQSLDVPLDGATRGPRADQSGHTLVDGVFCCGNALHVHDLVEYVSDSGEAAGRSAARWALGGKRPRELLPVKTGPGFLYVYPQFVDRACPEPLVLYFRSNAVLRDGARVSVQVGGGEILYKSYRALRPTEMERLTVEAGLIPEDAEAVSISLERKNSESGE